MLRMLCSAKHNLHLHSDLNALSPGEVMLSLAKRSGTIWLRIYRGTTIEEGKCMRKWVSNSRDSLPCLAGEQGQQRARVFMQLKPCQDAARLS